MTNAAIALAHLTDDELEAVRTKALADGDTDMLEVHHAEKHIRIALAASHEVNS